MPEIREGNLIGKGLKFAVVVSRFNHFLTDKLLEGAIDALIRHGVNNDDVIVYKVPGTFEIPLVAKKLAGTKKFNAVICIGAIIRGGTIHFDYIASEVAKGIASSSLETGVPITFGVITVEDIEQGIERAGTKEGNKGWEAAVCAIEMANLLKEK